MTSRSPARKRRGMMVRVSARPAPTLTISRLRGRGGSGLEACAAYCLDKPERSPLLSRQLGDAGAGEGEHPGKAHLVEWRALGGRLDLDDAAAAGQHKIGIGFSGGILGIIEIEDGRPFDDA